MVLDTPALTQYCDLSIAHIQTSVGRADLAMPLALHIQCCSSTNFSIMHI